MRAPRTALVIGGGIGGIVAANRLRKALPRPDRVVLVEREEQHVFQPSLLWVMTGARDPRAVARPLRRMVREGVDIVSGVVTSLDADRRAALLGDRVISGDAMSIGA